MSSNSSGANQESQNPKGWPSWLPIRSDLASLTPYGAPQMGDVVALNTNENPFPLSEELVNLMLQALGPVLHNLNRYPDRDAALLREKLAAYINTSHGSQITKENIWVANGSNEVIQTLALAFGERKILGFTPSYSVHPLIARVVGSIWVEGKRNPDFTLNLKTALSEISEHKPSLTFITTPNNPTGTLLSLNEVEELAKATALVSGLLIVDEAYEEFSVEPSAVSLIAKYPNLVVVRTMSKAFAFAGARVGYAVANPSVVNACLVTRLPYHLSSQTQAIASVALDHASELLAQVALLTSERELIAAELSRMGYEVVASSSNFLMFKGFKESATKAWEDLVDQGILIRDIGIDGYLRVSVGTPKENQRFLAAIAALRQ